MANSINLKTFNLYETLDPERNLWRNVLIVALEDAMGLHYSDKNYSYNKASSPRDCSIAHRCRQSKSASADKRQKNNAGCMTNLIAADTCCCSMLEQSICKAVAMPFPGGEAKSNQTAAGL